MGRVRADSKGKKSEMNVKVGLKFEHKTDARKSKKKSNQIFFATWKIWHQKRNTFDCSFDSYCGTTTYTFWHPCLLSCQLDTQDLCDATYKSYLHIDMKMVPSGNPSKQNSTKSLISLLLARLFDFPRFLCGRFCLFVVKEITFIENQSAG